VINRACKLFINTSDDEDVLSGAFNRTSANEILELDTLPPPAPELDPDAKAAADVIFGAKDPLPAQEPAAGPETEPAHEEGQEAGDAKVESV
jgi:recombination protein RecT